MKKVTVYAGAVVAFAIGALVGRAIVPSPELTVSVVVLRPESGVRVEAAGRAVGTTDATGTLNFRIAAAKGDAVELAFAADHFEPFRTSVTLGEGTTRVPEVALEPSPIEVALTVRALATDGAALPGAAVSVNGETAGVTAGDGVWSGPVWVRFGTQARVAVDGIATDTAFAVTGDPVALQLRQPLGVRVVISARHGVSGVEVLRAGEVLCQTDASGRCSTNLPVGAQDVVLSFRLPGARIDDWRIPGASLAALGRTLEHTVDVRPEGDIQLTVRVTGEGAGVTPGGYEVLVEGVSVGHTGADGALRHTVPGAQALVGSRLALRARKGAEGEGLARITIKPGQTAYAADIAVAVPLIVRLRVTDEDGRPLPQVRVRMNDDTWATTGSDGIAEAGVEQLGLEYKFTFDREGYSGPELRLKPERALTEREVPLQSLSFHARFVDSQTGAPVEGLEIYRDGVLLMTTIGEPERISIQRLGKQVFEVRSSNAAYPPVQQVEATVTGPGAEVRVPVEPRPFTFHLTFTTAGGTPIPNRDVRIKGPNYVDQKKTDSAGKATFSSHAIRQSEQYTVELTTTITYQWVVDAIGYEVTQTLTPPKDGTLTIRVTGGTNPTIKLFADKESRAQGRDPIDLGQAELVVPGLAFRDYEVLVECAEATVARTVTVDKPSVGLEVDCRDPYAEGLTALGQGDTTRAIDRFEAVPGKHARFSDAQKELCFIHNARGDFSVAYSHCKAAASDRSLVDPYLFLACAQSSHRARDFAKGVECAQMACQYVTKVRSAQRKEFRDECQYLEWLNGHDHCFDKDFAQNPNTSCAQRESCLTQVLLGWKSLVNDTGNLRDMQARIDQIEGEMLNLPDPCE